MKKLIAVDGGVLDESFSSVEHSLEFSVVGVVLFISDSGKVEISSSLIWIKSLVLSFPNRSHRACFSPHHAATRQSPTTPPMYRPDLLTDLKREPSFSISKELYFSSCWRLILLGSGMLLGLVTYLLNGLDCDIAFNININ